MDRIKVKRVTTLPKKKLQESFIFSLADVVTPFVIFGVPTSNGNRPFTLWDYYRITTYPYSLFFSQARKFGLIPNPIKQENDLGQKFNHLKQADTQALKVSFDKEYFLERYRTQKTFSNGEVRDLTKEEMAALYDYAQEFYGHGKHVNDGLIEHLAGLYATNELFIEQSQTRNRKLVKTDDEA